jgi:hypothetical protein
MESNAMLVLRNPDDASRIADPGLRALVQQRFREIFADDPYDPELHGTFIVVEVGDSVAALEKETGCGILHDPFEGVRFGHPDYSPSFEVIEEHQLEEHDHAFEMLFVTTDDCGIIIFIPKVAGIDADLLAVCAHYAVPAVTAE